jgi:hypothetical protein
MKLRFNHNLNGLIFKIHLKLTMHLCFKLIFNSFEVLKD